MILCSSFSHFFMLSFDSSFLLFLLIFYSSVVSFFSSFIFSSSWSSPILLSSILFILFFDSSILFIPLDLLFFFYPFFHFFLFFIPPDLLFFNCFITLFSYSFIVLVLCSAAVKGLVRPSQGTSLVTLRHRHSIIHVSKNINSTERNGTVITGAGLEVCGAGRGRGRCGWCVVPCWGAGQAMERSTSRLPGDHWPATLLSTPSRWWQWGMTLGPGLGVVIRLSIQNLFSIFNYIKRPHFL